MILDTNALSAFVDGDSGVGEVLVTAGLRSRSYDGWIAALAIQHSLPVLSRDEHFDAVPDIERELVAFRGARRFDVCPI